MSVNVMYDIRNVLLCLGFLIGFSTGILLIVRKRKLPGILALAGFFLFSLEPITDTIIFRVLYQQSFPEDVYLALDYIYPCITAPAFFLGSIALVAALFLLVKPSPRPPENNDQTQ